MVIFHSYFSLPEGISLWIWKHISFSLMHSHPPKKRPESKIDQNQKLHSPRKSSAKSHKAMDWFKGKFTGKPHIYWENLWFPVDFPLNQSIEQSKHKYQAASLTP
jgi:hypothetical protein